MMNKDNDYYADGLPAEFDPLGGNVGLSTPYIYLTGGSGYPREPEIPTLQRLSDESPMYVNGQRVTATLDGIEVSVSFALSALASGSAIPSALAPYMSDHAGIAFARAYRSAFRTSSETPSVPRSSSK
ncbi:MAG: hypothetical protein WKF90_04585 [Pyrinomonadaceae bacterium]